MNTYTYIKTYINLSDYFRLWENMKEAMWNLLKKWLLNY